MMNSPPDAKTAPTLLSKLRKIGFRNVYQHDFSSKKRGHRVLIQIKDWMTGHPKEFPIKLREVIRAEADSDVERFTVEARGALENLLFWEARHNQMKDDGRWGGFDAAIDTEDQIETAIRIFPWIRRVYGSHYDDITNIPVGAALMSLKTIPFVPLIWKLVADDEYIDCREGLYHLVFQELLTNELMLTKHNCNDDNFLRQLDEISFAALVRLRENGLGLRTKANVKILTRSTRITHWQHPCKLKRLQLLINWNPSALQPLDVQPSLLMLYIIDYYSRGEKQRPPASCMLNIFETLFDLGIAHYPTEMGFFFSNCNLKNIRQGEHRTLFSATAERVRPIDAISEICGREEVFDMLHKVVSRRFRGNSRGLKTLLVEATTNKNIAMDAVYLLCREHPHWFNSYEES